MYLPLVRAELERARGRHHEALDAASRAERLLWLLATPVRLTLAARAHVAEILVGLGEIDAAGRALAELSEEQRRDARVRIALAALRLAQNNPEGAIVELALILDGTAVLFSHPNFVITALVIEAIARDGLGDTSAAGRALERALDLAEPDGVREPFMVYPAPELLERHRRHGTAHAALISEILDSLAGRDRVPASSELGPLLEPLSESEIRVLRYLPTNLSAPEIAAELYLSVYTVKTHMRHIYSKLGVHRRADAVERARALGLLAPASRKR